MGGLGALAQGTPGAWAPKISTSRKDPSPAPEAHPGLVPTSCHGSDSGEEGRSPQGSFGALDTGREAGSARWEPSHTHLPPPWSLCQALPTGLLP